MKVNPFPTLTRPQRIALAVLASWQATHRRPISLGGPKWSHRP
jgi:hypothetical protein